MNITEKRNTYILLNKDEWSYPGPNSEGPVTLTRGETINLHEDRRLRSFIRPYVNKFWFSLDQIPVRFLDDVPYQKLKSLASTLGLSGTGDKEELTTRIKEELQ